MSPLLAWKVFAVLTAAALGGNAPAGAAAEERAEQPASRPAASRPSAPDTRPADLEARIRARVAELVEEFRTSRYKHREGARAGLLALHRAYVDAMTRYADDRDPEVRARVLDVLGQIVATTRFERVLVKLPKPQRQKLIRLGEVHPQIVADIFSLSWGRRLQAVKKIQEIKDDAGLAEPLLILCISHPWEPLATAAISAISEGRYRSDATVDALLKVLVRTRANDWHRGWYDSQGPAPHVMALTALRNIKSKRAAPTLLALMGREGYSDVRRDITLAEALGATGEKRAIPLLLAKLKTTSVRSTWSFGNVKITVAPSDPALMALLLLTGQAVASYGFLSHDRYSPGRSPAIYGFPDKNTRAKAIQKFQDWWDKHKDQPPYKNLLPLAVPDLARPGAAEPRT